MSLPIIPLSPLLATSVPAERLSTARALHAACVTHGFFYLDLAGFAEASETDELRALAQEFFSLSDEEKSLIWLGHGDWARGYQKLGENVTQGKSDAHEAIDFYAPSPFPPSPSTPTTHQRPLCGTNQWPPNPAFRTKFSRWVERMKDLGKIVMEAMALGLGLTSDEWPDLQTKVDDSFWVLRVIGYPSLPSGHDGFSCGAHKDYGCLTFLWADPTPGALQVYVPRAAGDSSASLTTTFMNGKAVANTDLGEAVEKGVHGTWIAADPLPGCVVCNIGEMWEIWTRGLYRSTLHRVLHRGDNYRISIPFFFEPNFTALIAPLPGVDRLLETIRKSGRTESEDYARAVEAERMAQKYEPVVYGDFLMRKVGGNFDKGENGSEGKGRYDGRG